MMAETDRRPADDPVGGCGRSWVSRAGHGRALPVGGPRLPDRAGAGGPGLGPAGGTAGAAMAEYEHLRSRSTARGSSAPAPWSRLRTVAGQQPHAKKRRSGGPLDRQLAAGDRCAGWPRPTAAASRR
jgi:hypothetical protein